MNSVIASSMNKKLILRSLTLKAQYCQLLIWVDPTTKTVPNDAKAESTIDNMWAKVWSCIPEWISVVEWI